MKFLADEGLDYPLVKLLRDEKYDVVYAAERFIAASVEWLLQIAQNEERILITKDKDFGELVVRTHKHTAGVVLIRIDKLNLLFNCLLVVQTIKNHETELANSFAVIQEDKIRIRTL